MCVQSAGVCNLAQPAVRPAGGNNLRQPASTYYASGQSAHVYILTQPAGMNNVVLWQRACRRLGLATSKGRAEVSGGGRKPRPQKGTGRSRQGSIRSPLWRGGGASHGPKPRDFSFKMNRKQRALGLKTALSDKYRRNALLVLDDPGLELGKTTELLRKLAGLGMSKEQP